MKGLSLKQVIDADARMGAAHEVARKEQSTSVRLALTLATSSLVTLEVLVTSGVIAIAPKKKAAFVRAIRAVRAGLAELIA